MLYNNTDFHPSLGKRLGAGLSFLFLSILGVAANLLVAYALYKNKKFFFRYPFYVLAAHILAASLGILVICQIIVAVPISLAGSPIYGEGAFMVALSSFDTLFFLTIFFVSFLISVNCFASVFSKRLHWLLFEGNRIHVVSAVPWILGLLWTIVTTIIDCPKVFRHDGFYFTYFCPDPMESKFASIFMSITWKIGYVLPAIMMLFYISVIVYIRWTREKNTSGSAELNVLIQALLICCALEAETLLFTFLPDLSADWGVFVISLLLDYALIFNASIYPVIMFIMNPKIHSAVLSIFGCSKPEGTILSNARDFDASANPNSLRPRTPLPSNNPSRVHTPAPSAPQTPIPGPHHLRTTPSTLKV